jgi:hypothetical protein
VKELIQQTWQEFIEENRHSTRIHSRWFTDGFVEVYLRAGSTYFDRRSRTYVPAVAVANVKTNGDTRGHYKNFIMKLEKYAKELGYVSVFIEQVGNVKLMTDSIKHGYSKVGESEHQGDTLLVKDLNGD